jgi:hypothetical protein
VLRRLINSPKIGPVAYTAALPWNGIMSTAQSTFQCSVHQEKNAGVLPTSQKCPYSPAPKQYGMEAQAPLPPDSSPKLDKAGIKCVQKIVGSILYYARDVDMTVLMALSRIAAEQTIAITKTMENFSQLLDYLVHNSDAKVWGPPFGHGLEYTL